MNGAMNYRVRRERERRLTFILMVLAAIILFVGLFAQIAMRAQISAQAKRIASLQNEIYDLSTKANNLDMNINRHHNIKDITARTVELGMEQPDETQLRVLTLPAINGNTSTQTVANFGVDEVQGY